MEYPKYNISSVARALGLECNTNRSNQYFDCPVCGGRKKLNIHWDKNVFRCAKCGEGGGPVKLYMVFTGQDARASMRLLDGASEFSFISPYSTVKETPSASVEERDRVYRIFLDYCPLYDNHRQNLENRGFDIGQALKQGYRSHPGILSGAVAGRTRKKAGTVTGIPGMYRQNEKRAGIMKCHSGLYIPVKDIEGRISCLQLRLDNPPDGNRYIWFSSSNYNGGCGITGLSQIHFRGFENGKVPQTVGITEGPLKRDIASRYLGIPFIALAGVGNSSQLNSALEILKEHGTKDIYEFFDMDYVTNPFVREAVDKNHNVIKSRGFSKVRRFSWNEKYKGIDDYLKYLKDSNRPIRLP